MSVSPFVREPVFDPEIIKVRAFVELLGDLEVADRNDPFAEVIAKEVLKAARLGVHDVAEMHRQVLCALRKEQ
jgi:hypothetical protein